MKLVKTLSDKYVKEKKNVFLKQVNVPLNMQAFRFMVGPGHCPMITKYGPSLSKAVGPVDPTFVVVKKSLFNKNIHLTASLQKVHVGCQYSKTCLKQPLKKRQNKNLNNKW